MIGTQAKWELGVWAYIPVFVVCAIASTPIMPYIRARLVAWAKGERVVDFMHTDLPHPKHLETLTLCDWEQYISSEELQSAPVLRARVFAIMTMLCDVALLGLLVLSMLSVVSGSFNPFIYFRF